MVSKRWQRAHAIIAHAGLAAGAGMPIALLETGYAPSLKLLLIVGGYMLIVPLFTWLHRRYATTFIKVFPYDHKVAARIVQRALNDQRLPFTKRTVDDENIVFHVRPGDMELVVETFLLNLMVDDHLLPEIASKLTLSTETSKNKTQMAQFRTMLDEAFAVQSSR